MCPQVQDLPSSPTLIIEALAENSVTPLTNPTLIHSSLIDYTHCAPTISIDTLSYMNYDTGEPLVGAGHNLPSYQHLVCLGALPKGVLKARSSPSEVCLIDLTLSDSCWKPAESEVDGHEGGPHNNHTNGTPHSRNQPATNSTCSVPPASWGDHWYTILKIR